MPCVPLEACSGNDATLIAYPLAPGLPVETEIHPAVSSVLVASSPASGDGPLVPAMGRKAAVPRSSVLNNSSNTGACTSQELILPSSVLYVSGTVLAEHYTNLT